MLQCYILQISKNKIGFRDICLDKFCIRWKITWQGGWLLTAIFWLHLTTWSMNEQGVNDYASLWCSQHGHCLVTQPSSPMSPVCAAPVDTGDPPPRLSNLEQGELRGKSASAAAHTDNAVIGRLFCCFVNTVIWKQRTLIWTLCIEMIVCLIRNA